MSRPYESALGHMAQRGAAQFRRCARSLAGGLALLAAFCASPAQAQWPMSVPATGQSEVIAVKTAANGDTIVAGQFSGLLDFGGQALTAQGLDDVFVARISPGGQVRWVRSAGGVSTDSLKAIALDSANSVYLVGSYFSRARFGGSELVAIGLNDGYVAKIAFDGTWQWARSMGGSLQDEASGVVALPGNATQIPPIPESVAVTGTYVCAAGFGPDISLNAPTCVEGSRDLYLTRLSVNGEWQWARNRGSAASGADRGLHLEKDEFNQVFLVGEGASSPLTTVISDDFAAGNGNWTPDPVDRALRSPTTIPGVATFFNGSVVMSLRGGGVVVRSSPINAAGAQSVIVSLDVLRGRSDFGLFELFYAIWSEFPDGGEDLRLEYLGSDNVWRTLRTFPGGGTPGELFQLRGETAVRINDPLALHANLQIRLHMPFGSGPVGDGRWFDWWHVDNIVVQTIGRERAFVLPVNNVIGPDPSFGSPVELPAGFNPINVAADVASAGRGRLLLIGNHSGSGQAGNCAVPAGQGALVISIDIDNSQLPCVWSRALGIENGSAVTAGGVAVGSSGQVLVTGGFTGTVRFIAAPVGQVPPSLDGELRAHTGTRDVFIGSLDSGGNWQWVTGGDRNDVDGRPSFAGGNADDYGRAIAANGSGTLYVGGRFGAIARFGPTEQLVAIDRDGFVLNLGEDGRFFEEERWLAGQPLVPPPNANLGGPAFQPDFRVDGQPFDAIASKIFYWAPAGPANSNRPARLIPLQPFGRIEVLWRFEGDPLESTRRISSLGSVRWPSESCAADQTEGCVQDHVVGAPVTAEPAAGNYKVLELVVPSSGSSGASYSGGQFNAERTGFASLIYVNGPSLDPLAFPVEVEVVRSQPYFAVPLFSDNVEVPIGQKLSDSYHNEPGRTGFVVNELAYYDGAGAEAAYNRSARTGTIVPVNRYSGARPQDQGRELAVAWYHEKRRGVYWPEKAVRYRPFWPIDPERIVIASQEGGENLGQAPLDPVQFPSARIYIQNDRNQPGYNPNDEHAFMAPSQTGTGFEAVFALRSDFGSALAGDQAAASDPYVLLKYYREADSEWRFRIFRVQATGAGYTQFRFSGTAGTTVSPPYPVRLLPGCAQTFVEGQAIGEQPPAPFFQDYKNQLWAKSAGSGRVRYYYPMQAGFFTDLNNNDVSDVAAGLCVPWLARLPQAEGGTESPVEPISVAYDISWPDQVPLLVSGETLLTPKRGLPDILNQAAVQVVYDDLQSSRTNPAPSETLAQLIDPLNPRFVVLPAIPSSVAKELRTDGTEAILGSADGVQKLPFSIGSRLSYEPLNRRLVLKGIADFGRAGDPFLLLNVLSKRDRVALKRLDGGNGSEQSNFTGSCANAAAACSWDQAVEALFRKSRNPQGITRICTSSTVGDDRVRRCSATRDPNEDDVLVGYEDRNNDGILEPYRAVGVQAALSAGLSQGSGYMTVAFNNDPALNPLPVSLEVIEVGCLRSPPPPATATLIKPYQGQINIISPENVFDEQLVLRHSGDFGGNVDAVEFEWFFKPDANGVPPTVLPSPETGQLNGWIQFPTPNPQGAVEISIEGANIQTLSDNWYLARYRGLSGCNNSSEWGLWAGQPGATPTNQRAQLAEGWVKRVLGRLNPFEARVQNFAQAATNNYASMLVQLGQRFEGPIALNNDPGNLNRIGLIEAYSTVMRRALQLSVDSTPPVDYGPANAAILLVASRLVDFYTLLGNEAYADAQDPTVGITTSDGSFSLAPSIFNFQNQLPSLLEEELILLRGRDSSLGPVAARPVYNRLFWNFTTGQGEVAYALSYNITDQNADGLINEQDARILYPQGHGDAWGHYLTATKTYYGLLKHPFYSWNPQAEAVLVAGVPIAVDFLDERQFAATAAAKARVGAEVVNLTYRSAYTENPNGQWQGYADTRRERAWGLSEWGRRAGMGAYYDWVTVNAVLPEQEDDPNKVGIQRIDRTTVSEIGEIYANYTDIQGQVDRADAGVNPLGLAKNVVPFDIDPAFLEIGSGVQGQSHFEQVYGRAVKAVQNAVDVWDFANQLNNQMRRNQTEVDDIRRDAAAQETDFSNQLIEIFGYPYADDIGPGGTYPAGYNGPDLYHYMYIDVPALAGTNFDFAQGQGPLDDLGVSVVRQFTGIYAPAPNGVQFFNITPKFPDDLSDLSGTGVLCSLAPGAPGCPLGDRMTDVSLAVNYTTIESPDFGFWFTKPASWTGQRRAPGRLQQILQQMVQARVSLRQALIEYDNLRLDIESTAGTLQATFQVGVANVSVLNAQRNELQALTGTTAAMQSAAIAARRVGEFIDTSFKGAVDCIPKNLIAGLAAGGDIASGARCAVTQAASIPKFALDTVADGLDIVATATEAAKEDVTEQAGIETSINDLSLELYNIQGELDAKVREEPLLRAEIFARTEALKQLVGEYQATLAEGLRAMDSMVTFRRTGAADIQQYRYQDMAFRIFRNDALQKYRAAFELAARYVYLAAAAYDYETNLLGTDQRAGQDFLTRIVRSRSIGQVLDGNPLPGTPGLADTLAQMRLNYDVLRGQMGFNNPQIEANRFSLRRELFRIPDGEEGDAAWRAKLKSFRVDDLWRVPEFRRYARPFAPESAGPQPGLVIEFSTTVNFGLNFFGWPLGANDSSYDSSQFSTRINGSGVWFQDYASLPLADDPRVYLIPVGADVLRPPTAGDFTIREWQVVDQAIPVPFPISSQNLQEFDWNPLSRTLSEPSTAIRRYGRFRAYNYEEPFDENEVGGDTRLVGRSVWNRRWLLIIPGGTFLNDPVDGLDTFIEGPVVPGSPDQRDGEGVEDIFILFKTYAYQGS